MRAAAARCYTCEHMHSSIFASTSRLVIYLTLFIAAYTQACVSVHNVTRDYRRSSIFASVQAWIPPADRVPLRVHAPGYARLDLLAFLG
jgi:hypothetical protein